MRNNSELRQPHGSRAESIDSVCAPLYRLLLIHTLVASAMWSSTKHDSPRYRKSTTIRVCRCVRGVVLRGALQWRFCDLTHRQRISAERVHRRSPLGLTKPYIDVLSRAVTCTRLRRRYRRGDTIWNDEVRTPHSSPPTSFHVVPNVLSFSFIDRT